MPEPHDVPDFEAAPLVLDTDGDGRLDTSLVDDAVGVEIGAEDQVYAVVDQVGVELAIAVGVEDERRRFEVRYVAGLMHGPPPVAR